MKILHTSDWHLGKVLKGQSRMDEQVAALAEIVELAEAQRPDLVIVSGDLYENAAPSPQAVRVLVRALSGLRRSGAAVVAIAGNHDSGAHLDALRGWAEAAGITLRGTLRDPADHLITGETAAGEPWRLVALPFVSQRYAVRATEMFELTAAEANQTYADHIGRLLARLTEGFAPDAVNLVTAHLTVVGAVSGGGERAAHTIQAYAVPATVFGTHAHYVALGHLHRCQQVLAPVPTWYPGSPIAVDFGEEDNIPAVLLVEAAPGVPASVREVPIRSATPLRTVRGTLADFAELASTLDYDGSQSTAWLRVYVRERPRAGLREEVQELLPRALEVRIDPDVLDDPATSGSAAAGGTGSRTPAELFADYLAAVGHDDAAVRELFDEIHAEVS